MNFRLRALQPAFRKITSVCAVLVLGSMLGITAKAAADFYFVKDLGANQIPLAINNKGQVLSWDGTGSQPTYLYDVDGTRVEINQLPLLAYDCKLSESSGPIVVYAAALNDLGEVLINAQENTESPDQDCVILYRDHSLHYVVTLGRDGFASDINDRSQIIGGRDDLALGQIVGFGPGCNFVQSDGSYIEAQAINDGGQILGDSAIAVSNEVQVCTDGIWQTIPEFIGESPPIDGVTINNRGEVVGGANASPDPDNPLRHAFLYSQGKTIDIGELPDAPGSDVYAESINNKGQIVGATYTTSSPTAFLYQDGTMYDLTMLISANDPLSGHVQLLGAAHINDSGVVAADGSDLRTGETHLYILTPAARDSGNKAEAVNLRGGPSH